MTTETLDATPPIDYLGIAGRPLLATLVPVGVIYAFSAPLIEVVGWFTYVAFGLLALDFVGTLTLLAIARASTSNPVSSEGVPVGVTGSLQLAHGVSRIALVYASLLAAAAALCAYLGPA